MYFKNSQVCHDMRGGYLEDRFFDGCTNIADEPYRLVHWALIDTWIYFSHNFITIPPWGWIQAAHSDGVKVGQFREVYLHRESVR